MEENKEFRYYLPLDLQKAKGIKVTDIEDKSLMNDLQLKDYLWDKPQSLAISNLPLEAVVYVTNSTPKLEIAVTTSNDWYSIYNWVKFPNNNKQSNNSQYDLNYNGNRIDLVLLGMSIIGAQIIPPELIDKFPKEPPRFLEWQGKIGDPLVKITKTNF